MFSGRDRVQEIADFMRARAPELVALEDPGG
jgi:hypothetical protein